MLSVFFLILVFSGLSDDVISYFVENIILVFVGFACSYVTMDKFGSQVMRSISDLLKLPRIQWSLEISDLLTIYIASTIGVVIALLPIIKAINKPVGRVLQ